MKKKDRIRDIKKGEIWKDEIDYYSLEDLDNKIRLAEWYEKKAGIYENRKTQNSI